MEKLNCVVTTAREPNEGMKRLAKRAAGQFKIPYVPRGALSLQEIKDAFGISLVLSMTKNGWVLHTEGGDLFFHLNMAKLRIKNLRAGQNDHMADAMRLAAGMSVLDCTLGLASDAVVSSFAAGGSGRVCGLEASPYAAFVIKEGLAAFQSGDALVDAALRRIEVVQEDYRDYLARQPDKSYDIVYFDPMFRRPIAESAHLKPLRCVADYSAVTAETLEQAKRVARQRVVFKENSGSREFERLAFPKVLGGKYSSVHYGVIEVK